MGPGRGILLIRLLIYLGQLGLTGDNQPDCLAAVSWHNVMRSTERMDRFSLSRWRHRFESRWDCQMKEALRILAGSLRNTGQTGILWRAVSGKLKVKQAVNR